MTNSSKGLMSCLKKRDLLNNEKVTPQALIAEGEKFWEAGQVQDALEMYAKVEHTEGLEKILAWAIEEGDFFTAKGAAVKLGKQLSPSQWASLGKKAMDSKKYHFALDAFTMAGDQENAERAREHVGDLIPPSRDKAESEEESTD
jgi:hypothetical protein